MDPLTLLSAGGDFLSKASGFFGGAGSTPQGPSFSETGPVSVSVGGLNVPARGVAGADLTEKIIIGLVVTLGVAVLLKAMK